VPTISPSVARLLADAVSRNTFDLAKYIYLVSLIWQSSMTRVGLLRCGWEW
jgi:hypothetical protein